MRRNTGRPLPCDEEDPDQNARDPCKMKPGDLLTQEDRRADDSGDRNHPGKRTRDARGNCRRAASSDGVAKRLTRMTPPIAIVTPSHASRFSRSPRMKDITAITAGVAAVMMPLMVAVVISRPSRISTLKATRPKSACAARTRWSQKGSRGRPFSIRRTMIRRKPVARTNRIPDASMIGMCPMRNLFAVTDVPTMPMDIASDDSDERRSDTMTSRDT